MPLAAALPMIIPAVGGMLGGLFGGGNKTINGTTGAETAGQGILQNQAGLQNKAAMSGLDLANANTLMGNQFLGNSANDFTQANNYLTQAGSTLQKPADYYGGILSGNRAAMMGAMAPEITTINNQANQAKHQLATMGPMGGGRASAMAQLPMQAAGQIGTMFQQARPQAAQGLLSVGNAQGNLGGLQGSLAAQQGQLGSGLNTNALSNLLNFGQGGTQTGSALLNYGLGRSEQNQKAGGAFGGGIYDILNGVPWTNVFKRGGAINAPNQGPPDSSGNWF